MDFDDLVGLADSSKDPTGGCNSSLMNTFTNQQDELQANFDRTKIKPIVYQEVLTNSRDDCEKEEDEQKE